MFGMAITANESWALLRNDAVQLRHVEHICGDVGVTLRAAIGHRLTFPWRGMTGFAFQDLGM
jgi:hypothetical protein